MSGIREVLEGRADAAVECGDGFALLRSLPDGAVDHVITDPPYAEKTHAGARSRVLTGQDAYAEFAGSKDLVDFDSMTDAAFLSLCDDAVRVARRWVLMTCDWRQSAAAECGGRPVVRCGVWTKPDAAPQFSGDRPGTGWEAVLILHRPGRKRWNGGGHHAVWNCHVERNAVHPTQKPLRLVRQWVKQFTDPGDLILDPFCGSGTTGLACMLEGRRFIGCELDEKYASLARRRVMGEPLKANETPYTLFAEE